MMFWSFKNAQNCFRLSKMTQKHFSDNPTNISRLHFWNRKIVIFGPLWRTAQLESLYATMWPWLVSLQRLQTVTKIMFGTSKSLKMSSTHPKLPKNTFVTIPDTYLDSILKMKKSTFPVRHRGLSPPPRTTPYLGTFFLYPKSEVFLYPIYFFLYPISN